jgi:hypothetical protein
MINEHISGIIIKTIYIYYQLSLCLQFRRIAEVPQDIYTGIVTLIIDHQYATLLIITMDSIIFTWK